MELVLVGVIFTALNFAAMEGFIFAYEEVFPPEEAEGTVEIYEVDDGQQQSTELEKKVIIPDDQTK